jgi:pyruvate dehydrogenase E1 component alpha subunit
MPSVQADGNDVVAVRHEAQRAVARARAGEGPSFLVFDTYRWREHCGPNYDNDIGYRSEEEFLEWRARCPVERMATELRADGVDIPAAWIEELEAEVAVAFEFARSSQFPAPETATEKVHA